MLLHGTVFGHPAVRVWYSRKERQKACTARLSHKLEPRYVDPPLWLEAWLREYFVVEDTVRILPGIVLQSPLSGTESLLRMLAPLPVIRLVLGP